MTTNGSLQGRDVMDLRLQEHFAELRHEISESNQLLLGLSEQDSIMTKWARLNLVTDGDPPIDASPTSGFVQDDEEITIRAAIRLIATYQQVLASLPAPK